MANSQPLGRGNKVIGENVLIVSRIQYVTILTKAPGPVAEKQAQSISEAFTFTCLQCPFVIKDADGVQEQTFNFGLI